MRAQELESALYAGRFDDGLLDLCVGLGLLGVGASWLSGYPALGSVMPAVLVPLWMGLRRRLTEPRLGRVQFTKARGGAERSWLAAALALGIGVLVVAVALFGVARGRSLPASLPEVVPILPGALLALGFLAVSAMIGARRFTVYALALVALATLVTWLGGDPGLHMAVGGGLLAAVASVLIARFLSTHPALDGA